MTMDYFELAKKIAHKEKNTWTGEYKGIWWEVVRFPSISGGWHNRKWDWCFYLTLVLERMPAQSDPESFWLAPDMDKKGRPHYDYYKHGVLSSIEWHGGMTWYSKESGIDGERRSIKGGCDYQHDWDYEAGGEYEIEDVKMGVIKAIESFRLMVPDYKYWCNWDGKLHDPKEIELDELGKHRCIVNCKERVFPSEKTAA